MSNRLIFVHGTGVRQESFKSSFELIKRQLAKTALIEAEPCFWGEQAGAKLLAGGVSIPDYKETGGSKVDEAEEALARWTILYADSWYELRLLGDAKFDKKALAFGDQSPADELDKQIRDYTPTPEFAKLMREACLSKYWLAAHEALTKSKAYGRAVATVGGDPRTHRKAISRALIARIMSLANDDYVPMIDGKVRDALVLQLGSDLNAYGLGVTKWLTKPFAGLGKWWVTRKLKRRRGAITDAAFAMPADIILYQTRGQPIRDYIKQAVDDSSGDEITLLAHSLGGIAAVDLLIETAPPKVTSLITVGSQAPFMYELNCLSSLEYANPLPVNFPRWLNIYDPRDILSYVGADLFGNHIVDVCVDNGQPFPESHSAYWSNPEVWTAVKDFLSG